MRANTFFVCLVVLVVCMCEFVNADATSNNFEDGKTDAWSLMNSYYTLSVVSGGAANTSKALRLAGGNQQNLDGALYSFPAWSPNSISFWVKAGSIGNIGGVMIGLGNDSSNIISEFRFKSNGQMGIITPASAAVGVAYSADTWYNIRFDFNWAPHTFAFYVNGVPVSGATAVAFKYNVAQLSTVYFFNSGDSTSVSYLDELYIGCPNGCRGSSCNSTSGVCQCKSSCGVDCSQTITALTKGAGKGVTTSVAAGAYNFYSFDAQGKAFDVVVTDSLTSLYLNWNPPASQASCAGFSKSISNPNYGNNLVVNISQCEVNANPSGIWTFGVVGASGTTKYTISVLPGTSLLVNNKAVAINMQSSTNYYFAITIPTSVSAASTLTYSATYYYSYYYYIYASNTSCPTTTSYSYSSGTSGVTQYSNTVPAVPGTTWYFMIYTIYSQLLTSFQATINDPGCTKYCGDNGVCLDGKCDCKAGWIGAACDEVQCPQDCNGLGTCSNGVCKCISGYTGNACQCAAPAVSNITDTVSYANWQYYSLDLSSYPTGAKISVSNSYITIYYGFNGCLTTTVTSSSTSNTNYWISYAYNTLNLDACAIANYGTQFTIGVYGGSSTQLAYNMSVAANPAPQALVTSQLWTGATTSYTTKYFTYDVPASTSGETSTVYFLLGASSGFLYYTVYVSNSSCPSANNYMAYLTVNTYSTVLSNTLTVPNAKGRLYMALIPSSSSYTITIEPYYSNCNKYCNGQGLCKDNACVCYSGFAGDSCDTKYTCTGNCNLHGTCIANETCQCAPGYFGRDCLCSITANVTAGSTMKITNGNYYVVNAADFPTGVDVTVTGTNAYVYYAADVCPTTSSKYLWLYSTPSATVSSGTCSTTAPTLPVSATSYVFWVSGSSSYDYAITAASRESNYLSIPSTTSFTAYYGTSLAVNNPDGKSFILNFRATSCNAFYYGVYVRWRECPVAGTSKTGNFTRAITSENYNTACYQVGDTASAGMLFDPAPAGIYNILVAQTYQSGNITISATEYTATTRTGAGVTLSPSVTLLLFPFLCALLVAWRARL